MRSLVFFTVSLCFAAGADAATLNADGTTCTLADAIVAANTDTATGGCPKGDLGADTIVLDADVTLTAVDGTSTWHDGLAAGLPDVTDDLTITAGLGSVIQRDPSFSCDAVTVDPVFRFLNLESGSLTLENLRFENGCAVADSIEGGGIWAGPSTELTLTGVVVTNFAAHATTDDLDGGFVYSEGDVLTLASCDFDQMVFETPANSIDGGIVRLTENGSAATISDTVFSNIQVTAKSGIDGGAFNSRADLEIIDSTFQDFHLVNDSSDIEGGFFYGSSGSATLGIHATSFRRFTATSDSEIEGGAIHTFVNELILTDVTFSDFDLFAATNCKGGAVNTDRDGPLEGLIVEQIECNAGGDVEGAAFHFRGNAKPVLRDCVFRDNQGRFEGSGFGGAIYEETFPEAFEIERCAFINNSLTPASSTVNGSAFGGAISANRITSMRNVTFSGNTAEAGDGLGAGADGGSAFGGALYLSEIGTTSAVANVTVTNNQAIAGEGADGFVDGNAAGGGLYVEVDHTVEIMASILSGNSAIDPDDTAEEDCASGGTLTSLGYNLAQHPDSSCDFSAFGDITGLDPNLYPIDDYGCDTTLPDGTCVPTAAVDQTSWAVDWSSCAEAGIFDDARGLTRRQDIAGVPNLTTDACDTGAFEARDSDGDGVTDVPDLCPSDADSDQSDSDGDQVGDACDACEGDDASGDSDGDLVCDDSDVCAGSDDGVDSDADTVPDGCDVCSGDDASGDSDSDGVCDDSDVCAGSDDALDADADGVPDGCDVCVGDDASGDSDSDGLCDDSDASVGDRVWLDDGDGIQDGGEGGIAGVTVNLYSSDDVLQDSTATDVEGLYGFSPGPGDYYLEFVLPSHMAFAPRDRGMDDSTDSDVNAGSGTTSSFTLAAGDANLGVDAGFEPAIIGNRVWLDADGDGVQQSDEAGLAGVTVRLLDVLGTQVAVTTTGEGGVYGFLGIPTGEYRVEVVAPDGHAFTSPDAEAGDLVDSDVDPETGRTPLFSYQAASASQGWDAGLVLPVLFADGFESGGLSAWTEDTP